MNGNGPNSTRNAQADAFRPRVIVLVCGCALAFFAAAQSSFMRVYAGLSDWPTIGAAANGDVFYGCRGTILRLTDAGTPVWERSYDSTIVRDILELPNGDLMVAVLVKDTAQFVEMHVGLMRTQADGTPLWTTFLADVEAPSIALRPRLFPGPGTDLYLLSSAAPLNSGRLARFTQDGELVFYERDLNNRLPTHLHYAPDGYLYAVGRDQVQKYTAMGELLWQRRYEATSIGSETPIFHSILQNGPQLAVGFNFPPYGADSDYDAEGILLMDTAGNILRHIWNMDMGWGPVKRADLLKMPAGYALVLCNSFSSTAVLITDDSLNVLARWGSFSGNRQFHRAVRTADDGLAIAAEMGSANFTGTRMVMKVGPDLDFFTCIQLYGFVSDTLVFSELVPPAMNIAPISGELGHRLAAADDVSVPQETGCASLQVASVAAPPTEAPFPIPADDHLTLPLTGLALDARAHFVDAAGRGVATVPFTSTLPTSDLPDGLYVLHVTDGDGRSVYRERVFIRH